MTPPACQVSLTSPAALRRKGVGGTWFGIGLPREVLEQVASAKDPGDAGDAVVDRERGASLVFVANELSGVVRVIAWKGLFAMNEVFYTRRPDGAWLLTDHFRNAISALPKPERRMSEDALVQHYTSGITLRRTTYARGVSRLMNGDRLDLDVMTGSAEVSCFSRHTTVAVDEPDERHLERIDGAFADLMASLRSVDDLAIGFSGGVDSTLLLSYLGAAGTPVTIKPGSPEFDVETEYARAAAQLLGRTLDEVQLRESDYLNRLEDIVTTQGMPIPTYASPATAAMYELPFSTFIVGEGADAIFGSGRGVRRVAAAMSGHTGRSLLRMLEPAPGPLGRRAKQIGGYAALLAPAPSSPDGYAARTNEYYGAGTLPRRMFGEEAIAAMNARFLEQIQERVELETNDGDGFHGHMEICLWQYVFGDRALVGRHSAHARGKQLIEPYLSWSVISEYLKVPARKRYYKRLTGKWIPRTLLARRVPDYQVNKPKLFTSLPFNRYYESGPLAGIWDRYEMPHEIPTEYHNEVRSVVSPVTWMAINHAIWDEHVVSNPTLQPHPAAIEESFSAAPAD